MAYSIIQRRIYTFDIHYNEVSVCVLCASAGVHLCPFAIGTYCACYMKLHTISERAQYKKTLAKFAAFLIIGNIPSVLNVVRLNSSLFPAIDSIVVYIAYISILLSFIPTPILIVVFLKPV